ncbi:hypothetical protein OF83DRAFT_1061699 [Amylostereum chailletii]|nr:hypothetical protein OF83DRAFT_1061699 [Amylostereum chailletii]
MHTRSRPPTAIPRTGDTPHPDETRPAPARTSETGRPLNVTDALSYLDAVKLQFQDKPDVYNHFLDIMKDFKGQHIDTPGVINRVSMLFHGNPYLIEGFNTFLPPGYHINASDTLDPHAITVTTPTGIVKSSVGGHGGFGFPGTSPLNQPSFAPPHSTMPIPNSRPVTPGLHPHPQHYPGIVTPFSPGPHGALSTTAMASVLGNMGNKAPVESRAANAGEFDHAIQYLNKIKTRFPDDPNTYKQFLEILQAYRKEQTAQSKDPQGQAQREQKMMHDVYTQVQVLFKDAEDLLGEFKDFLPDIAGSAMPAPHLGAILPYPSNGPGGGGAPGSWGLDASGSLSPQKQASSRRRKREPARESAPSTKVEPVKDARKRQRVSKTANKGRAQSPAFSTSYQTPPSPPALPNPHVPTMSHFVPPLSSALNYSSQPGIPISQMAGPSSTTQDELAFFDRAKKLLEAREAYDDFLKLLSMYTRDIIDAKQLVTHAEAFLGNGDLLAQFKTFLSWDDKQGNVEYGPPGSIRTGPPEAILPRAVDDGEGPSYRRLPDSEAKLATSGRDQLARSVLNDEWVSHPTWASEETGFVSHKKNTYEESIHRCEDERHEYQIHLEGLARTIAILEPVNARIDEMTHEERTLFKLKPDLGGQSKCIYQRTLKKVYGKDAGMEVYQALQESPSVAVPVVLTRLKQKNEEWRRAQREWGVTWRQVDMKNFYKSLDHTGINFKANDKKNITTKSFVAEIENIKGEQVRMAEFVGTPAIYVGSLGYQLEFPFADTSVLHDTLKLVYTYLDHNQSVYSQPERRSVEKFLRQFVPVLCMQPMPEFNAACGPQDWQDDDSSDEQGDGADGDDAPVGNRSTSAGVHPGDLRRKLLKTARDKSVRTTSGSATGSQAASPIAMDGVQSSSAGPRASPPGDSVHDENAVPGAGENGQAQDVWVRESAPEAVAAVRDAGVASKPFFANTTYYTLLRLLQLLYSRLLACKEVGAKAAKERYAHLLPNPIAVELGLDDPQGSAATLMQVLEAAGTSGVEAGDVHANVLYQYLLDLCEKMFNSDVDQAAFEEQLRWFFGTKAFLLYTVDKIIAALIKQVQTVVSDQKCQELWHFLRKHRNEATFTRREIIRYRREAERRVGADDNLYRIEWDRESKVMRVQLVGADEASVDDGRSASALDRWREYVDSYVLEYPTEWVRDANGQVVGRRPIFVRRCMAPEEGPTGSGGVRMEGGLAIRVSLGTYRMFYEAGSGDCFWREREGAEERTLRERANVRSERVSAWVG